MQINNTLHSHSVVVKVTHLHFGIFGNTLTFVYIIVDMHTFCALTQFVVFDSLFVLCFICSWLFYLNFTQNLNNILIDVFVHSTNTIGTAQ